MVTLPADHEPGRGDLVQGPNHTSHPPIKTCPAAIPQTSIYPGTEPLNRSMDMTETTWSQRPRNGTGKARHARSARAKRDKTFDGNPSMLSRAFTQRSSGNNNLCIPHAKSSRFANRKTRQPIRHFFTGLLMLLSAIGALCVLALHFSGRDRESPENSAGDFSRIFS